ncbi:MAG: hypothetical protein V4558_14835 [Gemmatimonadota bacterium]
MRRLAVVLSATLLIACAKKEPEPAPAPPAAEPAAPPPAPPPVDLNAVAGTWDMKTMSATSDSALVNYTVVASADTAGWMLNLPKRKPMKLSIMVMGDSVMSTGPEYESVLRKGVKVRTNSTFHFVGDKVTGTTVAHYNIKGADSLVNLRVEGTRKPK